MCKPLTLFHIMCGLVGWMDVAGSKLVVLYSSEKLVHMCQTARCHNTEDRNAELRCCKNIKSPNKNQKDSCDLIGNKFGYLSYKILSAVHRNTFTKELESGKNRDAELSRRIYISLFDRCLWFILRTGIRGSWCVMGCLVSGSRRSRHCHGRSRLPSPALPPPTEQHPPPFIVHVVLRL
jgi:hypothetical protein